MYGVHQVVVERLGSQLEFRRWSNRKYGSKTWLQVNFIFWEGESYLLYVQSILRLKVVRHVVVP